jgi:hypothetical protein
MIEAGQRHEGTISMTDSKGQKTTLALQPGQIATVLSMEDGQIRRQPFASPDVDAMLDDDHSDIPFHYFSASAFLVRLDQDEDFASDLTDRSDERLQGEAGEAAAGE